MNKEPITFQELIIIIFIFTMILLFSSCEFKYNNLCKKLMYQRDYQININQNTHSTDSLILYFCDSLK